MKRIVILLSAVLLISGCSKTKQLTPQNPPQEQLANPQIEEPPHTQRPPQPPTYTINPSATTIKERYPAPQGYTPIIPPANSFGEFLRTQNLKPYGEKALYFDGREKRSQGIYDSAFDVDIGDRDLHQCADAIMLLRGEHLYAQKRYDQINFDFVTDFNAKYAKWVDGYRIKVDGNNVSYYKGAEPSDSYESFRKYMTMVMAYAGTLSLDKELKPVAIEEMETGDIFIVGGSPGHAVIVVEMAENKDGQKIFLLAQSYMPAQQTQILINPNNQEISPWYSLDGIDKLITPEWNFELSHLKRF